MTREEAKDWLMAISFVSDHHIEEALNMAIKELSSDEVVHCKDCKHSGWNKYSESIDCYHFADGDVDENDFCSHGERKEDAESALYCGYGENWKEFKSKACEEAIKTIKEREDDV